MDEGLNDQVPGSFIVFRTPLDNNFGASQPNQLYGAFWAHFGTTTPCLEKSFLCSLPWIKTLDGLGA
jgi:hypothetical protein